MAPIHMRMLIAFLPLLFVGVAWAWTQNRGATTNGSSSLDFTETLSVTRIATGFGFAEGPAWTDGDGGYLVFSDLDASRLLRWNPESGSLVDLRNDRGHGGNGNAFLPDGRLVSCESLGRRVIVLDPRTGKIHPLVSSYNGQPLNAPNDVVVRSDGTIWFTDPDYQLSGKSAYGGKFVFRFDPATDELTPVIKDLGRPNGLVFSPDEGILYVNNTDIQGHGIEANATYAYTVQPDGSLRKVGKEPFIANHEKWPDGLAIDPYGNLFIALFDSPGIHVFDPGGALLGVIKIPEPGQMRRISSCILGGEDRRDLYVTAGGSIYRVDLRPLYQDLKSSMQPRPASARKTKSSPGRNFQESIRSNPIRHLRAATP